MTSDNNDSDVINDVSEEDSLLHTVIPGPRLFTLNNVTSTTLLGVLLEETNDSFLVGLPSRLIESETGLTIETFLDVPFIRLMKGTVLTVLYPFGIFKEKYTAYLIDKGKDLYPDISDIIDDLSLEEPADIEVDPEEPMVQGMGNEELKEYLTKKYNNGEIANGSGSKH